MSLPPDFGSSAMSSGGSPGPVPGLPTSPEGRYPAGVIDSRARNALILGVLGIVPLSIVTGIPAIVLGVHSLKRIEGSAGELRGRGAAWSAIVLGCISVLVVLGFVVAARA